MHKFGLGECFLERKNCSNWGYFDHLLDSLVLGKVSLVLCISEIFCTQDLH